MEKLLPLARQGIAIVGCELPAESMTPVPPSTAIAPTIPDDMLYEVVDGQVVEKNDGRSRETEIAIDSRGAIWPRLRRANRLGRGLG